MDPTNESFGPAPDEKDGPDHALSPPAAISGLERLLLVLAALSAALVFLPLTAERALLHWNLIGAEHEFIALLRKLGFWGCLACMAASWLLEKEKEEGGHQAWPGTPVVPFMSAGGTDGSALRHAGIPTYGQTGLSGDMQDVRVHGKDERVYFTTGWSKRCQKVMDESRYKQSNPPALGPNPL